jgi:hypothetical protein
MSSPDLATIIINARNNTGPAFDSAKKDMRDLGDQATSLKGTLTAIGVALIGSSFALKIKEAIDMQAALKDLSEQAGMTVEELSSLQRSAVLSGTSMETVVGAYQKLSKALIEAKDPMSQQAQALKAIGLSYEELAKLRPNEQFKAIADAMAGYNDGFEKNAVSMALFGKSGADLQKFLKELAAQQELTARTTNEQADAADRLGDQIALMKMKSEEMYLTIAGELVPALLSLMNAFFGATDKAGGLKGMIAQAAADGRLKEWCRDAALALAFVYDAVISVIDVVKILGLALAAEAVRWAGYGQAAMGAMQLAAGQTVQGFQNIQEGLTQVKGVTAEFAKDLDAILSRPQFRDKLKEQFKTDDAQREMDMLRKAIDAAEQSGANIKFDPDFAKKVEAARKEAEKLQKAFDALMGKIYAKDSGLDSSFTKDLKEMEALFNAGLFGKGEAGAEAYRKAVEELIKQQPFYRDQLKATAAQEQKNFDEADKLDKAAQARGNDAAKGLREMAEALELETQLQGLSNAERMIAIQLLSLQKAGLDTNTADVRKYSASIRESSKAQEEWRNQQRMWDELGTRGSNFFVDLLTNGRDAFKNLGQELKNFGKELLALFAKRWILTMVGQGSMAAQQGAGALAGGVMNMFTGGGAGGGAGSSALGLLSSGASLYGTLAAQAGGFVAGLSGAVPAAAVGANAMAAGVGVPTLSGAGLGSTIGSAIAAIPVWGWIAAAIAALAYAFKDKGENWKGQIGYGANAQAYTTDGVFGKEGFHHIAGDDALNKQIQGFMAQTGAIDKIIATVLSSGQIATITANLATYNRRTDGQPAEFAFGKKDETAGQQLTLEYLKSKYGVVFDEIDKTFADYVRNYKGKAEDLQLEIAEMAEVVAALNTVNISGLDLSALREAQVEGEKLSDTLKRVVTVFNATSMIADAAFGAVGVATLDARQQLIEFAGGLDAFANAQRSFYDNFYTDEEKRLKLQEQLSAEFQKQNLTLPTSREQYRALVEAQDLSTEEGRKLYAFLISLGGAFAELVPATQELADAADDVSKAVATIPTFDWGSFTQQIQDATEAWLGNVRNLFSGGNFGEDMGRQIAAVQERMMANQNYLATHSAQNWNAWTGRWEANMQYIQAQQELAKLQGALGGMTKDLARYYILEAQYSGRGQQLLELEKWYEAQKTLMAGNNAALLGLEEMYAKKRAEIIAQAGDQTIIKLQEYLRGTLLNQQLTPLNLTQQKNFAMDEYERLLALAKGGDMGAAGQLGGARDQYLQLLRQLMGSSAGYNAEFFRTYDDIRNFAKGGPTWQSAMQDALPTTGQRIASGADIDRVGDRIEDVVTQLIIVVKQSIGKSEESIGQAVNKAANRIVNETAMAGGAFTGRK